MAYRTVHRVPWRWRVERAIVEAYPPAVHWLSRWHRRRLRLEKEKERRRLNDANDLTRFEKKVFSQNGEDGILEEIFARIAPKSRFFVEFGVEEGAENCSRNLLENHGWQGVWIEVNPSCAEKAHRNFAHLPVRILNRMVTRENILVVFEEAGVPETFDLLVIDIDGNDYWVWREILRRYRPRVVVIEYNASVSPKTDWVMPYNPHHQWDTTCYFGAGLLPLAELGEEHGYQLVGCESIGVNAFFLERGDFDPRAWPRDLRPESVYSAPKYNVVWYGHPPFQKEGWRTEDNFVYRDGRSPTEPGDHE